MKSFFQYCDVKDKKINEGSGINVGRGVFGSMNLGGRPDKAFSDIMQYMIACISANPMMAKNGLKRMAGNDESLQNNLDSILHDDISINSLATQTGKVVDAMKQAMPQDDSDSEDPSGDEDLSGKMV